MGLRRRDYLAAIPAGVAVGLAVLYSTGAFLKAGQLIGADVRVRDTLPLVPLEQILALGIGAVVTSLLWVTLFTGLMWGWMLLSDERGKQATSSPAPESVPRNKQRMALRRAYWIGYWWLLVPWVLLFPFFIYPFFGAVTLAAGLLLNQLGYGLARLGRAFQVLLIVGYFVVVLAAQIGDAYVSPDPLPRAELHLRNGSKVAGTLLVSTSDGWYLSLSKDTFRMLPADRVAFAVVRSQQRREPRPVPSVIWSEIRSWFGSDDEESATQDLSVRLAKASGRG